MKKGIALIELIFAIVIISLVLTAVPNLISTASKSSQQAISQEAISNAASHTSMVMSQFWDEADTQTSIGNVVLDTNSTYALLKPYSYPAPSLPALDPYATMPKIIITNEYKLLIRKGSPIKTNRRYYSMDSNGTFLSATATLGSEAGESNTTLDDIDDYNGTSYTLITHGQSTNVSEGEYKDIKVKISTKVEYIDGNYSTVNITSGETSYNPFTSAAIPAGETRNVKLITVTITSDNDPNKKIIFKSFSANIGSSSMEERLF